MYLHFAENKTNSAQCSWAEKLRFDTKYLSLSQHIGNLISLSLSHTHTDTTTCTLVMIVTSVNFRLWTCICFTGTRGERKAETLSILPCPCKLITRKNLFMHVTWIFTCLFYMFFRQKISSPSMMFLTFGTFLCF